MNFLTQHPKVVVAAVVLVAIALFLVLGRQSGPEAAINGQLDRMAKLISFDTPEPQLEQLTTGRKFARLFTEAPYLVAWPGKEPVVSREQITGFFVSLRRMGTSASVAMTNRQITMDGDRSATVTLTVTAKVEVSGQSERHAGRYRMQVEKIDGEWLVSSAQPLE